MPLSTVVEITAELRNKIVEYVKKKGSINNRACRNLSGLGYDQVISVFNELVRRGDLVRVGKTSGIRYVLPREESRGKSKA